ncbi:hypothetical protein HAX54_038157 [Datura stramonium]|uniref:Translation initiation factor eIF2B subunit beta n=1 Tax=Datura stramonium TaxID=4076 RepID=A0ABS8VJF1_DATST|nr:hypothetical protein [Datura stramonium]
MLVLLICPKPGSKLLRPAGKTPPLLQSINQNKFTDYNLHIEGTTSSSKQSIKRFKFNKNMPDMHALADEFIIKLKKRKIEGSKATAKLTAEVLRSCISQQRLPHTNQAAALIDAIRAIGEKLIAANPVELAVGNIVRRVLNIIREEDTSHNQQLYLTSSGGDSEGKANLIRINEQETKA